MQTYRTWENSPPSQLGLFVYFPKLNSHVFRNSTRLVMKNWDSPITHFLFLRSTTSTPLANSFIFSIYLNSTLILLFDFLVLGIIIILEVEALTLSSFIHFLSSFPPCYCVIHNCGYIDGIYVSITVYTPSIAEPCSYDYFSYTFYFSFSPILSS